MVEFLLRIFPLKIKDHQLEICNDTVDGSEVRRSTVEVGRLSHYLQGFVHPRWCRISSINSMLRVNHHPFDNHHSYAPTVWILVGGLVDVEHVCWKKILDGGFKDFSFSSLPGEDEPILTYIFQLGWFNHQLVDGCLNQATTELRKAAVMKMFTLRPVGSSWCSWSP